MSTEAKYNVIRTDLKTGRRLRMSSDLNEQQAKERTDMFNKAASYRNECRYRYEKA